MAYRGGNWWQAEGRETGCETGVDLAQIYQFVRWSEGKICVKFVPGYVNLRCF